MSEHSLPLEPRAGTGAATARLALCLPRAPGPSQTGSGLSRHVMCGRGDEGYLELGGEGRMSLVKLVWGLCRRPLACLPLRTSRVERELAWCKGQGPLSGLEDTPSALLWALWA